MLKALDFDNELINLIEKEMDSMRKKIKNKIEKIPFWQLESIFFKNKKYSSQEEYINDILANYEKEDFIYQILDKDISILKNNEKRDLNIFSICPRALEGKGFSENQIEEFYNFVDKARLLMNFKG